MRFTLKASRDVIGNKLGSDHLSEPSVHFERHFRQAGEAGPGMEHTLEVKATDTDGNSEVATKIWLDEV